MAFAKLNRRTGLSAATVAIVALAISLVGATSAEAAQKNIGKLTCSTPFPMKLKEIHTTSMSKGTTTHQIYGAKGYATPWDHTSNVKAGYSSFYAGWDVHHWSETSMKSGAVFGTDGVSAASAYCA